MSENLGDTSVDSVEGSQTSGSEAEDHSQDTGDTGSGSDADEGPVPYERFKESRSQLAESKERVGHLEQQMQALQQQYNETAQWNQWAWQEMQKSQSSPQREAEADVYADPLERKVKELEAQVAQQKQFYDVRYQEMQVAQAERELRAEILEAKSKYPEMREEVVVSAIINNPNASVDKLAKRSHEAEMRRFEERLKRGGYKSKPKSLQRGRGKVAVKKDFGDSLEDAHAAYLASLVD